MSRLLMVVALAMFTTLSPAFAAFAPNRIVTAVDYMAKKFSCHAKPDEPSYTYKTTRNTRIRIAGKRVRLSHLWDAGNFSEIKVGEVITVEYHIDAGERIADRVTIYPKK
ncbi:MAG: hypothetical protein WA322_05945 [Pseudolabrys sp.]